MQVPLQNLTYHIAHLSTGPPFSYFAFINAAAYPYPDPLGSTLNSYESAIRLLAQEHSLSHGVVNYEDQPSLGCPGLVTCFHPRK